MPSARSYEVISTNGASHSKAHGITVIQGLSFTNADDAANFKFEPSKNLDSTIAPMLAQYGVEGTLQRLEVAGDPAGDFKLIWDYIDDNYSYYNTTINKYAVDLALEYAEYVQEGGDPLTDVVAKCARRSRCRHSARPPADDARQHPRQPGREQHHRQIL